MTTIQSVSVQHVTLKLIYLMALLSDETHCQLTDCLFSSLRRRLCRVTRGRSMYVWCPIAPIRCTHSREHNGMTGFIFECHGAALALRPRVNYVACGANTPV
jgi:hypothetical protein